MPLYQESLELAEKHGLEMAKSVAETKAGTGKKTGTVWNTCSIL